jgi:serine protease Do
LLENLKDLLNFLWGYLRMLQAVSDRILRVIGYGMLVLVLMVAAGDDRSCDAEQPPSVPNLNESEILRLEPSVLEPENEGIAGITDPDQASERVSQKVRLDNDWEAAQSSTTESSITGMTYVALSQQLKSLVDGREPSTLEELRELESQQSRVAELIKAVTVNIQQGAAQGSGVIITPDGYVLTAAHVAGGPGRKAWVILNDGTRVQAETLGMNRSKDAGLVRIIDRSRASWPYATLGRSADLKIGQWCIGAGHPGGWQSERGTVIRVGRIQRISPHRRNAHTLFTDCALIGGDSGGPLFTLDGKLIGIHSRIGTDVTENMHVPIDVFKDSWSRMTNKEAWGVLPGFDPPYIGVKGENAPDSPPIVTSVESRGPADLADIQAGDLILSVDDQPVQTFRELVEMIAAYSPGDSIVLKIRRGDSTLQRPVIVGSRKSR